MKFGDVINQTLGLSLSVFLLAACGTSVSPDGGSDAGSSDGGRVAADGAVPGRDGGALADGGVGFVDAAMGDAGAADAGADTADAGAGGADGGAAMPDAGLDVPATCDATSCGTATCGRSDCGFSCGQCAMGDYCYPTGCSDLPPGGTVCRDAFGEGIIEGDDGFRRCDADPTMFQRCMCSGGGADAWFGCGPCQRIVLDGGRGSRCTSDDQCGGGLPCHPNIGLCGERCDRDIRVPCPASTVCVIPGDIAGVCLDGCSTCGGDECGADFQCAPNGEDATACVPRSYSWFTCP